MVQMEASPSMSMESSLDHHNYNALWGFGLRGIISTAQNVPGKNAAIKCPLQCRPPCAIVPEEVAKEVWAFPIIWTEFPVLDDNARL